ncbi:hypothetical protein GQ44DRAFT_618657 [Phaeosphaeriaceae sp. PMI808]|nr:hypothetical protein GQ44DRAFT_618657 [Phaeosphaeriaceae sp. PMI808]
MRPSTILTAVVALSTSSVGVLAQASLPTCAATCFGSALANQTVCQPTDTACICGSQPLNLAIQGCVLGSCTLKEALSAVNTTNAMCDIPIRDRSKSLIITNAVFGALALVALGIRMLVSIQQHIFGLDDACAIVASVFAAPVTYGQLVCGLLGFGKDTWAVPPENIYTIMKVRFESSRMKGGVTDKQIDRILQPTELLSQLGRQQTVLFIHVSSYLSCGEHEKVCLCRYCTLGIIPDSFRNPVYFCL